LEAEKVLFGDNKGKIMLSDEVDELSACEIEEREIHVLDEDEV